MDKFETLRSLHLHFSLLPPHNSTVQILLLPSQSVTVDLSFFLYSSPGIGLQLDQCWKEFFEGPGNKGVCRRVVTNTETKPEYIGLGSSGGGSIVVVSPDVVCEEGICVRDGNLIAAFGVVIQHAE